MKGLVRRHPVRFVTLIAVIALLVPAANLYSFLVHRNRLADAWEQADRTFQQGNFSAAGEEYEQVRLLATESQRLPREHVDLAEFMRALSAQCRTLEQRIKNSKETWGPTFTEWNEFRTATVAVNDSTAADAVLKKVLEFPISERRDFGPSLVTQAALKLIPRVYPVPVPDADALARLDEARSFLEGVGAVPDEIAEALRQARRRLRLVEALRDFQESCDRSVKSLEPIDLNKTKGRWRSLKEEFPDPASGSGDELLRLPGNLWDGYVERLKQELRQRIRVFSGTEQPAQGDLVFGHVGMLELPILPTQDFTALAVVSQRGLPPPVERVVFTRVEDRCYALNEKSGHPVWALRTGYDAAALPLRTLQGSEELLIVPWVCDTGHALSVADKDLKVRWTWQLPPDAVPTGAPVVSGDSLFASLSTGQVVQLALADGRFLGVATLPSTLVGPLHASEDGRDAVIVGDNLAIYFFQLHPLLTLTDILLPDAEDRTVSACAAWVPPFALICTNDLAGNCELTVHFRDRDGGFRQVAARPLPGRVWQPPIVNGTRFLVITDLGTEAIYGLRIDDLSDPLFETFRSDPPVRDAPRLPFSQRHLHAPFLAAVGREVMCYGLDLLEPQAELRRKKRWSRVATDAATVPLAPLQTTDAGVVVAVRNGSDNLVRTECLDLQTGEILWRTDLGTPLAEWRIHRQREGGRTTILARSEAYEGFRLSVDDAGWTAERLAEIRANASVGYTFETFSAVWTEVDPPELRQNSLEGVTLRRIPLRAPASGPVQVIEGRLQARIVGEDRLEPRPGVWALFTDVGGRLQCVGLDPELPAIQAAPLPGQAPGMGWFRPLDIAQGRFAVAHPEGWIALFRLLREERIPFLQGEAERFLSGGLVEPPVVDGERLWTCGRDGFCRALSSNSLTVLRRVRLPGRPRTARILGRTLAVALDDGTVAAIDLDADASDELPRRVFTLGIASVEHVVAGPSDKSILAIDARGQLFGIDLGSDRVILGPLLPPASLPPLVVGNSLLLGSREGGVTRIPLDTMSAGELQIFSGGEGAR